MNEDELRRRANEACELCGGGDGLVAQTVEPRAQEAVLCCTICAAGINGPEAPSGAHWRCLLSSMWSETPAVQVLSKRMLLRLAGEPWAAEALDMLYLDPELEDWVKDAAASAVIHRDSNGTVLEAGDTVTLIKDLPVKGAGFTAKRGTAVRSISLVAENAGHIEGRVEGQRIVILTEFVKKR
ncbi:MAG: PhnA domain-containing protein [Paracoccaceae bacterium]